MSVFAGTSDWLDHDGSAFGLNRGSIEPEGGLHGWTNNSGGRELSSVRNKKTMSSNKFVGKASYRNWTSEQCNFATEPDEIQEFNGKMAACSPRLIGRTGV